MTQSTNVGAKNGQFWTEVLGAHRAITAPHRAPPVLTPVTRTRTLNALPPGAHTRHPSSHARGSTPQAGLARRRRQAKMLAGLAALRSLKTLGVPRQGRVPEAGVDVGDAATGRST